MDVASKDGTSIAVWVSGRGAPLVLVHGTTADHSRWTPLLPPLEARFTVHAMDRRGRGGSGDAANYSLAREFEDVAAVVEAAGEPAFLLGHSYGALCALEAALRTSNLRKLILYEPPLPLEGSVYPPGAVEKLQAILDRGAREEVVTTFYREVVCAPEAELEAIRAQPNWPARVAAAHTIPREMRIHEGWSFEPARLAGLRVPTMLLLGGASAPLFARATEALARVLPNARTVVLEGQGHSAMNTAPERFLDEVVRFLES
jgi:pimeloyl-ACP methyl ester carboxylesterase